MYPPPPKEPSKQTNKKKLLFLTYNELILNELLSSLLPCKVKLNTYVWFGLEFRAWLRNAFANVHVTIIYISLKWHAWFKQQCCVWDTIEHQNSVDVTGYQFLANSVHCMESANL